MSGGGQHTYPRVILDGILRDQASRLADKFQFPHPYLLVDVEHGYRVDDEVTAENGDMCAYEIDAVYNLRDRLHNLPFWKKAGAEIDAVCNLRDRLHTQAAAAWKEDTELGGTEPIPLPAGVEGVEDLRVALRGSQREDSALKGIVSQLDRQLDPEMKRKRKTGESVQAGPLRASQTANAVEGAYRLAPLDGVLERFVVFSVAAMWLPCIPDVSFPVAVNGSRIGWRRWIFLTCHETFLHPHRTAAETFQVVRRMGFWETLASDVSNWCLSCIVCRRFRGHAVLPPVRSILAGDQLASVLPWLDVLIDVQGPFTKAETGEQYVLSYHSIQLRVPFLEPFMSLQAGYFSRALVACVMRSYDRTPAFRGVV